VSNLVSIKQTFRNLVSIGTVAVLNPFQVGAIDVSIFPPEDKGTLDDFTIANFVSAAISILLGLAGVLSFFYLLWGGIQWIMAGGDKEGTEKARKKITASLVGLAIVFSAYALLFILQTMFGVKILEGFKILPLTEYK
jgi:hypothetical protein